MGEMITTRNPRVQRIMKIKDQERQWRKNWAELKWGQGRHFIPTEERLFSNTLEDGAWKGQRCFIIGGGPSLKGFDFSKLKGELVIGINRAYEKADCTIIFSLDSRYYMWIVRGKLGAEAKKKFEDFKGYKVWLNSASFIPCPEDIHLFNCIGGGRAFSWSLKNGLAGGCNSGYGAVNLAVCLGANPIYLLGFDMKGDGKKQAWWHDGYPAKQPDSVYKKFIERFNNIAPELKTKGLQIINLNPDSALRCFEFGKFEDIRRKTITVITPTGDRPLAFALCRQWMKHQTLQPDQWIVVDDGKRPLKPSAPMQYVRREPRPDDPEHTLILNLKTAMPLIKGDNVMIIEDDEYYASEYIEEMARRLNQHEVAGIGRSKYYHLPSGGNWQTKNTAHASLAETGFRDSFLPEFKELLNKNTIHLDFDIWKKAIEKGRGFLFIDSDKKPLYVGIKGLPGRCGIGIGHNPNHSIYRRHPHDLSRNILKQWIPKDHEVYMDVLNGKLTDKNYQSYFPDITGITVCFNTKDLIERTYASIRKFHPYMPIIIVDGSDPSTPCASYVKTLASDKTEVISPGYNIGHGEGMCVGIEQVKTKYALTFDSDIKMLKSPINQMLEMMEEDTFGVGVVCKTGFDGVDCGLNPHHKKTGCISYLHPYFQLINIENYKKFHPYVNHGAPCILTMIDIHKKGLSEKILKDFPKLETDFVKHYHRGTWNTKGEMKTIAFVTRVHPRRPNMLKKCMESVKAQTSDDYIHVLFRDDKSKEGYGVYNADKSLMKIKNIDARYAMVLDDDDMLVYPDFVKEFKSIVGKSNVDIVFFKGMIDGGIFPPPDVWGKAPAHCKIGSFNFAVRLDIWMKYIHTWNPISGKGCADYWFIAHCYDKTERYFWLDRVVARTQKRPGHGKGEHEHV